MRTVLLTNCIPPYYVPVYARLCDFVGGLRIFVSTPMEGDRDWTPQWGDLSVTVQKCWTRTSCREHANGFLDKTWRHVPYDTILVLFRERPDIVISAQLGFRTLMAVLYRRLNPKSRLIIWSLLSEQTEKGLSLWRTLQRTLLLRSADAVIANGASGRNYLTRLHVPPRKIFRVPYCPEISAHLRSSLRREADVGRRFIYFGQLISRKGLEPFLKILSVWLFDHPERTCEFWIVGDGPLRSYLERLPVADRLQLRFLGSIPYDDLPQVYLQAGILVFPTLADEWGVVVNEALASGLPILGSEYSQAVEELVENGINGWTFRPDEATEVYAAIDRAMNASDQELDQMRRNGREKARHFIPDYGARCFLKAVNFVGGYSEGASYDDKRDLSRLNITDKMNSNEN